MHFKHRLGKRATAHVPFLARPIAALERAGVRATYALHDRLVSNPPSRRRFTGAEPTLDATQRRVLDSLRADGYAIISLADLFSQEAWEELSADAGRWTEKLERQLQAETEATAQARAARNDKAFLRRRYQREPVSWRARFRSGRDPGTPRSPLTPASPWLQLAVSERMLAIVDSYLGLWAKLSYADQWHTPPRPADAGRRGSMHWHRDFDDRHVVKVFVYLVDVDEATGPLEYVSGSADDGPYGDAWAWRPLGETYPPPDEFERGIPRSARRTFTAPAGSMIFCDTSGFHRGGFATGRARDLFVLNYVSPAAIRSLVTPNHTGDGDHDGLSQRQRFALK